MPALSDLDKSRCRFHLAIGPGVPAGDRARLEEAMNTLQDNYEVDRVREILARCDRAFTLTESVASIEGKFDSKELYVGDINRAVIRETSRDYRTWWENYLRETDLLAQHPLWVPNYRREEYIRYRFARIGGEFIKAVPGPADTCISDRLQLSREFA
jgi:hypothetical protein